MGRDLLPKRTCVEESRRMDVSGEGGGGEGGGGGGWGGGGGGGKIISDDVVFFVGKRRQEYTVSAESLMRGSSYFRNLLQRCAGPRISSRSRGGGALGRLPPVVMDCDESVFESMLLLMRYGTWEALPPMSKAEIFRLKREAEFYGVQYIEPPPSPSPSPCPLPKSPGTERLARPNSSDQSSSSTLSPASSPSGSPKSDTSSTRPPASRRLSGRYHEGAGLAGRTCRQLTDLPDFPLDLSEPAKLVLVACLDEEKAPTYACPSCSSARRSGVPTQWALSFHHRHAFCIACGRAPNHLPPKHFAEMFTEAAAHYHSTALEQDPVKSKAAWWVGSDSTCTLRFVSGDACSSTSCSASAAPHEAYTVWATTFYYSHAFCTHCGKPAYGPVLLSLLLALRYGGAASKGSKAARSSFKIPATPAAPLSVIL